MKTINLRPNISYQPCLYINLLHQLPPSIAAVKLFFPSKWLCFSYSAWTLSWYSDTGGSFLKSFGIIGTKFLSPTWTKALWHPKQACTRLNHVSLPRWSGAHHHKSLLATKSCFPWQQVRCAFSIGLFASFTRPEVPLLFFVEYFFHNIHHIAHFYSSHSKHGIGCLMSRIRFHFFHPQTAEEVILFHPNGNKLDISVIEWILSGRGKWQDISIPFSFLCHY